MAFVNKIALTIFMVCLLAIVAATSAPEIPLKGEESSVEKPIKGLRHHDVAAENTKELPEPEADGESSEGGTLAKEPTSLAQRILGYWYYPAPAPKPYYYPRPAPQPYYPKPYYPYYPKPAPKYYKAPKYSPYRKPGWD